MLGTITNQRQVNTELRKMKAFIEKEAQEKAKEIRLKANEEYEIEKASAVRTETAAIDLTYEQKLKKASLAQQIKKSTIGNRTRLRILATKEEVLDEIFNEAAAEIKKSIKKGEYKTILAGLIEEGLLALLEDKVIVRARKDDISIVKDAAIIAAKDFESKAKFPVEIIVDEENFLHDSTIGGVFVTNISSKIEVNNTLEERLKLLSEEALPGIRLELFGPSTTRKFFD